MKNRFLLFVSVIFLCVVNSSCKKGGPDHVPPSIDSLGVGWQKIETSDRTAFVDVSFPDNNIGYIVGLMLSGKKYIGKSTDGGQNWTRLPVSDSVNIVFSVHFIDADHGWVVCSDRILRTENGGNSWQHVLFDYAYEVQFLNINDGFAVHSNGLMKTINGGRTWTQLRPGAAVGVFFIDANNGWYADNSGNVRKTTDGGVTFPFLRNLGPSVFNYNMQFTDTQHGWLAGNDRVFRTQDGGDTWKAMTGPYRVSDIHFFDNNNGYILIGNNIYLTTNGGGSFETTAKIEKSQIAEIHFSDMDHGWAVGAEGGVYKYVRP